MAKNEFTVTRTKNGDSGMLRCDVLLPEMAKVEKVGGPGKEFWVFGENYPNAATTRPDPCNERGAWRVEVTPSIEAVEYCFLNVIQVSDKDSDSKLDVRRIDAEKVVGAWKVFANGKLLETVEVSESAGTIYFNGPAGKYTITNK